MEVTGLVLAAGEPDGTGAPYALRKAPDGTPWLDIACTALRDAGCREVIVVLGAGADAAMTLVPHGALPVVATDWQVGQAEALRVGLAAAATSSSDAVLLTLVNLPEQTAAACRQVIDAAIDDPRGTLARAHYNGKAGHPVLRGPRPLARHRRDRPGRHGASATTWKPTSRPTLTARASAAARSSRSSGGVQERLGLQSGVRSRMRPTLGSPCVVILARLSVAGAIVRL